MLLFCDVGECSRNGATIAEMPETVSARIPTSFLFIGVMLFLSPFFGFARLPRTMYIIQSLVQSRTCTSKRTIVNVHVKGLARRIPVGATGRLEDQEEEVQD